MSDREQINRRDFIVTTAGVAGTAGALGGTALAQAQTPLPPGFDTQDPLIDNWQKQLSAVVDVDPGLKVDARELEQEAVRERHRIYCYLLMKLIAPLLERQQARPARDLSAACQAERPGPADAAALPWRHDRESGRTAHQLGSLPRTQHCVRRRGRQWRDHRLRFQPQRLFPQLGRARRVAHGPAAVQPHRYFRQLEDRTADQRQVARRLAQRTSRSTRRWNPARSAPA